MKRHLLVFAFASLAIGAAPPKAVKPVPEPEQIIGFKPGTDRKLADFGQVSAYFKALAAASPRVRLFTIGGGGRGREAHALTESYDTTDSWMGTQYALLLTVTLAQR